ncbi:MAG: SurA N-terminal domain-containing protein [Novosphingobium sp.]|nr:SurA N-terminal domain-containing protein [Novosphingobium sp.]
MKRKLALTVAAIALLGTLSACGDKQATGQVVAVVNGEEITQQELNAELGGMEVPPSVDKKKFMADLLQRIIDRKLLVQRAKGLGLDKSPEYVLRARRLEEDLAVSLLSNNAAKSIALPDQAAVTKYIADHPGLFAGRKRYALDQIAFPLGTDENVLRQLEPAHTLDAVAAILTAAHVQFTRGPATLDTALTTPEVAQKIAELPPGEPFVLPLRGQYFVSVIKSETPVAVTDAESKPMAVQLIRNQGVEDAMKKQLDTARSNAKIEYQPGFAPAKDAKK